ncbi:MAG: hypothetical protein IV093_19160 [Rubrivivax sp.]|nr:hypothetical protein [Rubrivivax sp.]
MGTWLLLAGLAVAEPLPAPAAADIDSVLAPPQATDPAESPVDVQTWVERQTTSDLLQRAADRDRLALLEHGWQDRAPTWIQAGATVNLADFPSLDDATGKAERDIKTLEWVLEEQRRQRAGQQSQQHDRPEGSPDGEVDRWLRTLIPRELVVTLKANREWVAAGGTALLVLIWATAAFARRPTAMKPASEVPEPPRRRRRRRAEHSQHADLSTSGTRPVPLTDSGRTRY